jgi:Flp pilus assembly protein TadG
VRSSGGLPKVAITFEPTDRSRFSHGPLVSAQDEFDRCRSPKFYCRGEGRMDLLRPILSRDDCAAMPSRSVALPHGDARPTVASQTDPVRARRRRGTVILYAAVGMIALCGMVSLGVDVGRVQIARSQLQAAADAAARYGVTGVKHEINDVNASEGMARALLRENKIDASYLLDTQSTVEYGEWSTSTRKFKNKNETEKRNAVRVTVRCNAATGTAIPLVFGTLIGKPTQDITATAVAMIEDNSLANEDEHYQQRYVPATSNLWLSGMPAGTLASVGNPHNNPDYADSGSTRRQSPVLFADLSLRGGSTLTFDGVNGGANNLSSSVLYNGDGNTGNVVQNLTGSEHSKSNINAPINSVIAVFLDDNTPSGAAPASLNFSTDSSRDFSTLSPKLNQVFFIGDGRRANGDIQQFVIPSGATRLFVGTMDSYEWNNNIGGFTVTVTTTPSVKLVQ